MQSRLKSRQQIRARGQHMLISEEIADRFVNAAGIANDETILEIGTGTGMITKWLCTIGKKIISYEIDRQFFEKASQHLSSYGNLELKLGDAFSRSNEVRFDVCVTSLPYSESLRFVKWLSLRSGSFKSCIAIVQSEFVEKITSVPGSDSYRAVSIIAQVSFEIERLFTIQREAFQPPPKVLSEVVRLTPRKNMQQPFFDSKRISLVNQLFSFRGRLLSAAIKKMEPELRKSFPEELLTTRIEDFTPDQMVNLILKLQRKAS